MLHELLLLVMLPWWSCPHQVQRIPWSVAWGWKSLRARTNFVGEPWCRYLLSVFEIFLCITCVYSYHCRRYHGCGYSSNLWLKLNHSPKFRYLSYMRCSYSQADLLWEVLGWWHWTTILLLQIWIVQGPNQSIGYHLYWCKQRQKSQSKTL